MSNLLSSVFSLDALYIVLVAVYVVISVLLVVVIMVQKGKGAGFAGAFGLGAGSETIFGPRGSKSVPVRLTRIGAGLFIFLAFVLSALSGHVGQGAAPSEIVAGSDTAMDDLKRLGLGGEQTPTTPATEPPAPATEIPVVTEPVTETPAPAAEAPAAPAPAEDAAAPAAEAPAPEAPAAPADGGAK